MSTTAASVALQSPLRLVPRAADRLGPGLLLALVVHALLLVALSLNVDWHSEEPVVAEAEIWSATPQIAAPRAVEPPTPIVAPPAPQPTPPAPDAAQLQRDADIALERQRDKDRQDKARRDQAELERQRALEVKAARERDAKQQQLRLAAQDAERKRLQAQAKTPPKPTVPPPQDNAQREANLKRILGEAGANGDPGATGNAQKSAGFSASYGGRIAARIKPNVVFPDALQGNPAVEIELRMSADGRIVSRRVMKPSGVREWDDAVLRAIDKTDVLPADEQGRVPPIITLVYHPKDLGG